MMESQSDFSSQGTIMKPYVIGRIQNWMRETTFLTNLLQSIPPSDKTAVEKWLQEQKESGRIALATLLQSILSSAETKIGLNFHLEAQHSKRSNKQISEAPETSNSSGRKEVKAYLVTELDKPLDEGALSEASGKMPEVRLVIKSPYIRSKDLETLTGSIRYPSRAPRFKHMFGVIQDSVDFTVKSDLRFDTHKEPFVFWCDIVYDPASNGCYLHNLSGRSIYLTSSGKLPMQHTIADKRYLTICSGAWRISIKPDQTPSCSYPIFDILVRDKCFSISADNDNMVATVSGGNLFSQDVQYTPTSFRSTRTDLLKLINGETVRIKDLHDDEKTYSIRRLKEIARSQKSHVFSCQHSRLPSIKLVAKVFCFNKKSLIHKQMKREIEFLKQLRHPNIISLKAADPRVFALYLEHLPLSLDENDELDSSWADAKTILFNIASALAYLSKRGIVHYDVKPQNIAFSRKQGAILFDFDLADYTKKPKYGKPGGTFGFLPPETIDKGKSRGFPGDVWALGVTILWIVKIYTYPLATVVEMDDLHQENSPTYRKVKEQLDVIALQRNLLDIRDKVQTLVYKMLEPNIEARVTAAAILSEDDGKDRKSESGKLAQKRKHSSIT